MSTAAVTSSGSYQYLRNGEVTGIEEHWESHRQGEQHRLICTRRATSQGIVIRVESQQQAGRFQHCAISWQQAGDPPAAVTASYRFEPAGIQVSRDCNGELSEHFEPDTNCVFSPLMRIYNGAVIRQLQAAGGSARVLVPWIKDARQLKKLLAPEFSQRHTLTTATETLLIANREHDCDVFEYWGGEYQRGTLFWLDSANIMLQYRWRQDPDTLWEVRLQDYTGAPTTAL